ncbi:MAG TPA: PQQ-binding-like beta-propeller repeat protein [Bacteroidales bacterium]|nr:PQQ-binding-like beta-propeller repeat protein [Bacteroidales bacterium]
MIVGDIAYIVNKNGEIAAINIKSKELLWSFKTDDTMFRCPAVSKDVATVITTHGHIYGLDTNNGKVLWSSYKEGLGYTNTIIAHDMVYVGCADNYLYAFNLKTGKEFWKFKSDSPVNTPLVNDGIIYFTSGNYLYSIQ